MILAKLPLTLKVNKITDEINNQMLVSRNLSKDNGKKKLEH